MITSRSPLLISPSPEIRSLKTYTFSLLSFLLRSFPHSPALRNSDFIPEINFNATKNVTQDMTEFTVNGYIIL